MSTVEIRAGSQICKGEQRQVAGRHLNNQHFVISRNFGFTFGLHFAARLGRGLGMGRKGRNMLSAKKKSRKHWMEWFPMLVLWGILAGAAGGLAIGLISSHSSSSTTSTAQ